MLRMRRSWIAAAVFGLVGCSNWTVVELSATAVEAVPTAIRITRPDGTRIIVVSPRVTGDSLVGIRQGSLSDTISMPLLEVNRVAVRTPDREKNSALILFLGVAGATFGVWVGLVLAGS
jgi:hypothetical protein